MIKLFFRVESKVYKSDKSDRSKIFNKGFYSIVDEQGTFINNVVYMENNGKRHPLPDEDTKLKTYWESLTYYKQLEHFFGFSSFEQLKRWFYKDCWLSELDKYLVISVYSVSKLHEGYTQSICRDEDVIEKLVEFPVIVTECDISNKFKYL